MKISAYSHRKGMTLVAILMLCSLLVIICLRFWDEASWHVRVQANREQVFVALLAAHSAMSIGMASLFHDTNMSDDLDERWTVTPKWIASAPLFLNGASATVLVVDESSKMNVNMVTEDELTSLLFALDTGLTASSTLLNMTIKQGSARRLAQCILDYIDEDNVPRPMGAEQEEYKELGLPPPANQAMRDIRELLNIPGVTQDTVQGHDSHPGLFQVLTTLGEGRINLNTAFPEVIEAIPGPPGYSEAQRADFFKALYDARPFKQTGSFRDFLVVYDKWISKEYSQRFCSFSQYFMIEAEGWSLPVKRKLVAFIFRKRDGEKVGRCRIMRLAEIP